MVVKAKNNISNELVLAFVLILAIALAGCGSAGGGFEHETAQRMVFSHFQGAGEYQYANRAYTAAAPFTIACYPNVQAGDEDDEHTRWYGHMSKCEIDFGDGGGWQDVTARKLDWDALETSTWERHTYTAPGEYDPAVRVTYWDGEVLYQDERFAVHVSIQAPTE